MNSGVTKAPACLILTAGAILLDGENMRHIILKDVDVYYNGGPVALEDLTFVNCRLFFADNEPCRRLALTILSSAKVAFTSTSTHF